jgi:hypothetical protein
MLYETDASASAQITPVAQAHTPTTRRFNRVLSFMSWMVTLERAMEAENEPGDGSAVDAVLRQAEAARAELAQIAHLIEQLEKLRLHRAGLTRGSVAALDREQVRVCG